MKNITLTIEKHDYEQREFSTVDGFVVVAKYKYDGSDAEINAARGVNTPVMDALNDGLGAILKRVAMDYETAAVKIVMPSGYTATQAKSVVDKYSPEAQFTSITFA